MSQFQDDLKTWIDGNDKLPANVKNYALQWIKEGLKDWILTRDMEWGIPVPLDEAKGKVKVMVTIFGRETPVELDFLQVKKV